MLLFTKRNTIKRMITSKYLVQNMPSFTISEHLFLQSIKSVINANKQTRLSESLNIEDEPIH